MKTQIASLILGLALLGAAKTVSAQSTLYDIQYLGNNLEGSAPQQTGAALVGQAGDQWNYLTSGSGTQSLLASDGSSSGVDFSWTGWNTYSYFPSSFGQGAANLILGGYLYSYQDVNQTMSFSGLGASQTIDLFIYTQGDSGAAGRQLFSYAGWHHLHRQPV